MKKIGESELILNTDGSVYHLHLKPEHIADDIIIVGDPERVKIVSNYFDKIEYKIQNREFITHTGYFRGKRISVISTGIGTDNIDIAINELDAVVNIDLQNRCIKEEHKSLNIIRIGTSGALQENVPTDSFVFSSFGLGLDGLLNFYKAGKDVQEKEITEAFISYSDWSSKLPLPYIISASKILEDKISKGMYKGITATTSGFYAPQGRVLRLELEKENLNKILQNFQFNNHYIINFEMETSALYGLGKMLGHQTATVCAIIANRYTETYSYNHEKTLKLLIELVLNRIVE